MKPVAVHRAFVRKAKTTRPPNGRLKLRVNDALQPSHGVRSNVPRNVSMNATVALAALEEAVHGVVNCSNMVPGLVYDLTVAYTDAAGAVQRTLPYGAFTGTSLLVEFSFLAPFVISDVDSASVSVVCTLSLSGGSAVATADGVVPLTLPDADRAVGRPLSVSTYLRASRVA